MTDRDAARPGPDAVTQRAPDGLVAREIAELAYLDYVARYGVNSQSLDTLLARGGFSWDELVVHLFSRATATRRRHEDLVRRR